MDALPNCPLASSSGNGTTGLHAAGHVPCRTNSYQDGMDPGPLSAPEDASTSAAIVLAQYTGALGGGGLFVVAPTALQLTCHHRPRVASYVYT
jgi:hypothetical protein